MRGIRQHGLGRTLYEECMDGVAGLTATGRSPEDCHLLAFYPHVSRNPFQRMLYARGFEEGYACFPIKAIDDVLELPADLSLIMHYHWLHKIFDDAGDARNAGLAARHFLERVKRQKEHGHAVVWTVHNILSHSGHFPEEEIVLRRGMAELADAIHIMNPETVDLCAAHYEIPCRKVMTVPHPSYAGVYGDYVSRGQARFNLDLQPEDQVFLLFGSLGPHKGTRQFLAALDLLQEQLEGRARVIIAGTPGKPKFMEDIMNLIAGRSDVQLFQTHVDDQSIQAFFKASDVVVCPYPRGLNSGVMVTAAGFGKPSVVPRMMAGACEGIADFVVGFDAGDMESCISACVEALGIGGTQDASDRLKDWADKHRPAHVSSRFFRAMTAKLKDAGK